MKIIDLEALAGLLDALKDQGYTLVGPALRDGAIVYDELQGIDDLPAGWTDEQAPGRYQLHRRSDAALFGYNVGPHSWKRFLFPPALRLWRSVRDGGRLRVQPDAPAPKPLALVGVRPCELAALAVQDKVFLEGRYVDPHYQAQRSQMFILAVNCGVAGGSCFCASTGTGPKAQNGYDLALTELLGAESHEFLVAQGSAAGAELLAQVTSRPATAADVRQAEACVAEAAAHMGRSVDLAGVQELLARNYENPQWQDVADRCLSCANCTMVCPTCFCSTIEDVTDLTGDHADRWRYWDSCFNLGFSYIAGGNVRSSVKSRYRQWLTHKLSTWHDQFGTSGCVGCGRCITWCPVGIDLTEEIKKLRSTDAALQGTAAATGSV